MAPQPISREPTWLSFTLIPREKDAESFVTFRRARAPPLDRTPPWRQNGERPPKAAAERKRHGKGLRPGDPGRQRRRWNGPARLRGRCGGEGRTIAASAGSPAPGAEEIDAPRPGGDAGFVDIHTHYDGQATWDQAHAALVWHGVTTVVMGNCGVGFRTLQAGRPRPADPADGRRRGIPSRCSARACLNWRAIPTISKASANAGSTWISAASFPHAAAAGLRDGRAGREPRAGDGGRHPRHGRHRAPSEWRPGPFGFGTSRTLNHRSSDGSPIATLTAGEDELTGIAMGMAAANNGAGRGVCRWSRLQRSGGGVRLSQRIVETSGRPLSYSLRRRPPRSEQWRTCWSG